MCDMVKLSSSRGRVGTLGALGALMLCGALAACALPRPSPFDGHAFDAGAMEAVTAPSAPLAALWRTRPDGTIALAGTPSGYVATRAIYSDYRLHVEWRWPGKAGNGGVLLHVASGPKDGVWPLSQQVQTKHGFAGDVLPMAGAAFSEPLTSTPGAAPAIRARMAADSERPVGEWNSMDVTCRDGAITVAINGVPQNRVTAASPRAGRIAFQLEGVPYELRNLRIEGVQ
jgi:hypothetical protein